jgi:surface antigen
LPESPQLLAEKDIRGLRLTEPYPRREQGDFAIMAKRLPVALVGIALVASLGLSACETKQDAGTAIGAITGAVIGNQFGKGSGKVATTFAGAIIGGIVGNAIGKDLDDRDRELARQAEFDAWEHSSPGKAVRWTNPDNGRRGEIVAEGNYVRGPSRCRDYVHTVWIDGRRQQMRGTACRDADGTWRQVS